MHQPKKNSTNAQANLGQSTEAAIKLLPRNSSNENKFSDGGPIDKDGFEGSAFVRNYVVEVALNGFFVTITYDDLDTPDLRYVVQSMDEVIEILRGKIL